MRKLKLLFAAFALTASTAVWAQEDVTNTYITNADFSEDTPIDNHLCGYGKDMGTHSTTYYGMQPVTGWEIEILGGDNSTAEYPNSGFGGAVFAYGSEWEMKGNSKKAPAAGPEDEAGQCLGYFAVWTCGAYYYQEATLPAGTYTISVSMYNASGEQSNTSYIGFVTADKSYTVKTNPTVGVWSDETVTFTLTEETEGRIAIGYRSTGGGSGANNMLFIDKISISWTDPVIGAKSALQDEITAAETLKTTLSECLQSLLGSDILAAQGVYDNSGAAVSDVLSATDDLKEAEASAKAAEAIYKNALDRATEAGMTLEEPASYADVYQMHKNIYNAVVAEYTMDGSSFIPEFSKWDGDMVSHSADEAWGPSVTNYFEQTSSDWGSSAWTRYKETNVTLPVGKYAFIFYARAAQDVTFSATVADKTVYFSPKNASGRGVTTSGVASYDPADEYYTKKVAEVGGEGNGWDAYYILYESTGDPITIRIEGTTATNHQWMSFNEPVLLTTEDNVAFAKENLKKLIDDAQAIYEAKEGVGSGLFMISEAAWTTLGGAITAGLAVYNDAGATVENVNDYIAQMPAAVNSYKSAVNEPDFEKIYFVKNATITEEDRYLALVNGEVKITASKQGLKFVKTEGGYFLTDGEQYVGLEGSNNWTMSAFADKKAVLNFAFADDKYTISEAKGMIGTDGTEDSAPCYANKAADNNGEWTIEEYEAEKITLNEENIYAEAGMYVDATLTRTINAGWNALVLPFAVETADFGSGAVLATYDGDEKVEENLKLNFTSVSEVVANTPFLLYAPAAMTSLSYNGILVNAIHNMNDGTYYDFVGFYGDETSPVLEGDYIMTGGKLQMAAGSNAIKPYRAYFVEKSDGARFDNVYFCVDGETTGIQAVERQQLTDGGIYSLSGVRQNSKLQKGVYIQNGKKLIVK